MEKRRGSVLVLATAMVVIPLLTVNWRQLEKRQVDDGINRDLVNPNMPPSLALTTQAVGPFRGLISNALWWRAYRLQDDGQHFEAIQLADWISSLQPKIAEVWRWQGWNMAFNISAAYDAPEEQWKWIMAGVDLLRENGLRYNPGDKRISNQIAEILWLKMRNDHYRQTRWAREMSRYLKTGDLKELAILNESAADEEALRSLPGVSEFLNDCAATGMTTPQVVAILLGEQVATDLPEMIKPAFTSPETAETRELVRRYGARNRLTKKHLIDLDRAITIDERMGPLDWRTFHAHVIYWGTTNRENETGFRAVRQALNDAFYSGRLLYVDDKNATFSANVDLAGNIHHYVVEFAEKNPGHRGAQALSKEFHERAVLLLYSQMYEKEAKAMFEDYRKHLMTDAQKRKWTFETFVAEKAQLLYNNMSINKGRALIYATISQAYFWAARGDAYRAKGYERLAKLMWNKAKRDAIGKKTLSLDPFDKMCKDVLVDCIGPNSPYPKEVSDTLRSMSQGLDVLELKEPKNDRPKIDLGEHAH